VSDSSDEVPSGPVANVAIFIVMSLCTAPHDRERFAEYVDLDALPRSSSH